MEISRTTRYGILAAIWVGTFLSVCIHPFMHHTPDRLTLTFCLRYSL